MSAAFTIERLGNRTRASFSCGVAALDRYFAEQVSQDVRRGVTNCFVAIDHDAHVAGYYSLSSSSMSMAELPAELARRLPRYPVVPTALIGRLAVSQSFQRRGLGGALLADAAARARNSDGAVYALTVDAKDDTAVAFYAHHGFRSFANVARRLYLPIARGAAAP